MGILSSERNPLSQSSLLGFTHGIDMDPHVFPQEIRVQKAWVKALQKISLLDGEQTQDLLATLGEAQSLMESGKFDWKVEDEDIHMNIERFVTEKLGELGKKMHLGRSRNDLIATTLRLFVHDELVEIAKGQREFIRALLRLAEDNIDVIIPGATHLQNGQPVSMAHVLLSHVSAGSRDVKRLEKAAKESLELMPLGSAALAGTHLSLDLENLASDLGFDGPAQNAYDAVGSRDFIINGLNQLALMANNWSRFCEDIIVWSSAGFQLVRLPEDWSTGSSIMPNKRNPDVCEIVRGKSSHIMSAANNALMLGKALPTSYVTDFHELKRVLIFAVQQVKSCLVPLTEFSKGIKFDKKSAETLLNKGHVLATHLTNELCENGLSFREAYKVTAQLVELAEKQNVQIHHLNLDGLSEKHEGKLNQNNLKILKTEILPNLNFETALSSHNCIGGTSKEKIGESLEFFANEL